MTVSAKRKRRTSINHPIDVDDDTWFYLNRSSVTVVRVVRDDHGAHLATDQFSIPWRTLLVGLKRTRRHFAAKRRAKK